MRKARSDRLGIGTRIQLQTVGTGHGNFPWEKSLEFEVTRCRSADLHTDGLVQDRLQVDTGLKASYQNNNVINFFNFFHIKMYSCVPVLHVRAHFKFCESLVAVLLWRDRCPNSRKPETLLCCSLEKNTVLVNVNKELSPPQTQSLCEWALCRLKIKFLTNKKSGTHKFTLPPVPVPVSKRQ